MSSLIGDFVENHSSNGMGARKGNVISTSSFARDARDYTPHNETRIVLNGSKQLARLIIGCNRRDTTRQTYELKKIYGDYLGLE